MSIYERSGYILAANKRRRKFLLRISEARSDPPDYYCVICCPALFDKNFKMYGASREQVRRLATKLVRELLADKTLIDSKGRRLVV